MKYDVTRLLLTDWQYFTTWKNIELQLHLEYPLWRKCILHLVSYKNWNYFILSEEMCYFKHLKWLSWVCKNSAAFCCFSKIRIWWGQSFPIWVSDSDTVGPLDAKRRIIAISASVRCFSNEWSCDLTLPFTSDVTMTHWAFSYFLSCSTASRINLVSGENYDNLTSS